MSVSDQITRIRTARDTIRTKLISLGLGSNTDKLDDSATQIQNITKYSALQVEVTEGKTYSIPAGYHDGSGTVTAISDTAGDAEKYKLQTKTFAASPTEDVSYGPDQGYYGFSSVTIQKIPSNYQDTTGVTASQSEVLSGEVFVGTDEETGTIGKFAGTMPNNGATINRLTINGPVTEVSVPSTSDVVKSNIVKGYHNGAGAVFIQLESKAGTPTKKSQTIVPSTGKLLKEVIINPIPDNFTDSTLDSDVAASSSQILDGKQAYVNNLPVEGTMPNNGAVSKTLDFSGNNTEYPIPEGYHNGLGKVNIVGQEITATPNKSTTAQTFSPANGKVISKVTVNPIPDDYIITTDATATVGTGNTSPDILAGKTAYVNGEKLTGSMAELGSVTSEIVGLTSANDKVTISAGYTTGGTISLSTDIETSLSAI